MQDGWECAWRATNDTTIGGPARRLVACVDHGRPSTYYVSGPRLAPDRSRIVMQLP